MQTLKLAALTTIVSVPLGVGFALALDRSRGRSAGSTNFLMMFLFVVPELISLEFRRVDGCRPSPQA